MRIVIQSHPITTRCERCLPQNVLEQHRGCFYVLEETKEDVPGVTLVIRSEAGDKTYQLTPAQIKLMKTEGPEVILAEIDAQN